MENINSIIHQPVRLNIMSLLHMDKSITFSELKKELNLSDGNLWTHLEKLEKSEYIKIEKSFVNKKPQSTIIIEKLWEKELLAYITNIEKLFKWINQ
jgi:DNA-binding Lrp family transcriptional regulator